jgi:succinate dehydrogenase / fumarate reductase membrane anchor subunit
MKKHNTKHSDRLVAPLAKARGLGSNHHGSGQWLAERVSALIILPLVFWLTWSVVHMDHDYASFTAWLHQPLNALLMILTLLPMFYHSAYGLIVVIEDYVHGAAMRFISVYGVKLVSLVLAIISVVSILKIAFTG